MKTLFNGEPALPIKEGAIWHTSWNMPIRFAIDDNGQCWADNARGHPLEKITAKQVLSLMETDSEYERVANILGEPVRTKKCSKCGHTTIKR